MKYDVVSWFIAAAIVYFTCTLFNTNANWFNFEGPLAGDPPCAKVFFEEYHKPFIMSYYDCSNKAANYYRALKEAGYPAKVAVIAHEHLVQRELVHVVVFDGNRWHDPTEGIYNRSNVNTLGKFQYWVTPRELATHKDFSRTPKKVYE